MKSQVKEVVSGGISGGRTANQPANVPRISNGSPIKTDNKYDRILHSAIEVSRAFR